MTDSKHTGLNNMSISSLPPAADDPKWANLTVVTKPDPVVSPTSTNPRASLAGQTTTRSSLAQKRRVSFTSRKIATGTPTFSSSAGHRTVQAAAGSVSSDNTNTKNNDAAGGSATTTPLTSTQHKKTSTTTSPTTGPRPAFASSSSAAAASAERPVNEAHFRVMSVGSKTWIQRVTEPASETAAVDNQLAVAAPHINNSAHSRPSAEAVGEGGRGGGGNDHLNPNDDADDEIKRREEHQATSSDPRCGDVETPEEEIVEVFHSPDEPLDELSFFNTQQGDFFLPRPETVVPGAAATAGGSHNNNDHHHHHHHGSHYFDDFSDGGDLIDGDDGDGGDGGGDGKVGTPRPPPSEGGESVATSVVEAHYFALSEICNGSKNVHRMFIYNLLDGACFGLWQASVLPVFMYIVAGSNSFVGYNAAVQGICQMVSAIIAAYIGDNRVFPKFYIVRIASILGSFAILVTVYAVYATDLGFFWPSSALWGMYIGFANPGSESIFADSVPGGQRVAVYTYKWILQLLSYLIGYITTVVMFEKYGDKWHLNEMTPILYVGLFAHFSSMISLWFLHDEFTLKVHKKKSMGSVVSSRKIFLAKNKKGDDDENNNNDDDHHDQNEGEDDPHHHHHQHRSHHVASSKSVILSCTLCQQQECNNPRHHHGNEIHDPERDSSEHGGPHSDDDHHEETDDGAADDDDDGFVYSAKARCVTCESRKLRVRICRICRHHHHHHPHQHSHPTTTTTTAKTQEQQQQQDAADSSSSSGKKQSTAVVGGGRDSDADGHCACCCSGKSGENLHPDAAENALGNIQQTDTSDAGTIPKSSNNNKQQQQQATTTTTEIREVDETVVSNAEDIEFIEELEDDAKREKTGDPLLSDICPVCCCTALCVCCSAVASSASSCLICRGSDSDDQKKRANHKENNNREKPTRRASEKTPLLLPNNDNNNQQNEQDERERKNQVPQTDENGRKKVVVIDGNPTNMADSMDDDASSPAEVSPMQRLCAKMTLVPILIVVGDIMQAVGGGVTVRFFPLFFMNDLGVTPVELAVVSIILCIFAAILSYGLKKFSARFSRAVLIVVVRFLGSGLMFLMEFATGKIGHKYAMLSFFVLRSALLNSMMGLSRSIIMDFCRKRHRTFFSAMESVSTLSFSGSAAVGGVLADEHGYRSTFGVTGGFYVVAALLVAPAGKWVDRHIGEEDEEEEEDDAIQNKSDEGANQVKQGEKEE